MNTNETTTPDSNEINKTCAGHCCGAHSHKFKIAALITGFILVALVSFAGGLAIGFRKARFSYRMGPNNGSAFDMNRLGNGPFGSGMMREFQGRDLRNPHGISGTITAINGNNLTIKDRDEKETTVAVSDTTAIRDRQDNLKISDLQINEQITVIGNPGDNGIINATLIRVFSTNLNNGSAPATNNTNSATN
jgi:hypothetical protein